MSRYASMKSAAMDGRFLILAFKDECTNANAKRSGLEICNVGLDRFLILAFKDERTNANANAKRSELEICKREATRQMPEP